jgi:hypothetical protein
LEKSIKKFGTNDFIFNEFTIYEYNFHRLHERRRIREMEFLLTKSAKTGNQHTDKLSAEKGVNSFSRKSNSYSESISLKGKFLGPSCF